MPNLERFRNLMVMAIADGKLTEEELRMLSGRAVRWGISVSEFDETLEYAMDPAAHITIPAQATARRDMLRELLRMMAIDGELADIEKRLFAVAAATMKIEEKELNEILDNLLS